MKANEILAQRAKVVNDMQAMLDTAETSNRDLNETEKETETNKRRFLSCVCPEPVLAN